MLNDIVIYIMTAITCFALGMNVSTLIRYNNIIKKEEEKDGRENHQNNFISGKAETASGRDDIRERCTLEEYQKLDFEDFDLDYDADEQGWKRIRRNHQGEEEND